jgi:hypothetical protein
VIQTELPPIGLPSVRQQLWQALGQPLRAGRNAGSAYGDMEAVVDAWLAAGAAGTGSRVTSGDAERLRALGYVE